MLGVLGRQASTNSQLSIKDLSEDEQISAFHKKVMVKNIKVVKSMLKEGYDIQQKDRWQRNAVMYVGMSGNIELMEYISEQTPEVFEAACLQKDVNERTVLHWACESKTVKADMIKLLAKAGVDLDAEDDAGITPAELVMVADSANPALNALFQAGADPCHRDPKGNGYLDFCKNRATKSGPVTRFKELTKTIRRHQKRAKLNEAAVSAEEHKEEAPDGGKPLLAADNTGEAIMEKEWQKKQKRGLMDIILCRSCRF